MDVNDDISGVLYVDAEKGEDSPERTEMVLNGLVATVFGDELDDVLENGLKVTKKLVSRDYYQIKCPYAMDATRIVIHNTYNDAPAINEINYMLSTITSEVSFHFAVDDVQVVQGIPLDRNAWHAGDGSNGIGNRYGVAIEICYSRSGGNKFTASEKNASKLVASLLYNAGWGIEKITKHQDYSGKYCPHRTLDLGWSRFINMCKDELNKLSLTKEPYSVGTIVYNTEDLIMESTVYEDGAKGLLPKNSLSKVYKYFIKDSILWMALADGNGIIRPQAWTKQLGKITITPPSKKEPYAIGTIIYNTEDLIMESTVYEDGTKGLLPKNSLSKVYKYFTKGSTVWMALTDGNGVVRTQAWTKQLDKFITMPEDNKDKEIAELRKKILELEALIKEKNDKIDELLKGFNQYPIGTIVYNTEDLMLESTVYENGTRQILPKKH